MNHRNRLTVVPWPSSTTSGDEFVDIFAESLRAAGCRVVSVKSPFAIDGQEMDVFHIHWPEKIYWTREIFPKHVINTLRFLRELRKIRSRGTRLVWMVHNLRPHDQKGFFRKALWAYLSSHLSTMVDGFMTLSPKTIVLVEEAYPALRSKPRVAILHPTYHLLAPGSDRNTTRMAWNVGNGGRVYGWFGMIRPYKGIEAVISAFMTMPDPHSRLIIAGRPAHLCYTASIESQARKDARIIVIGRELGSRDYADLERACDVVVLPFVHSLHSGSLVHALSAGVPVLTCDRPFARSMADAVGREWVHLYEGELTARHLAAVIIPKGLPNLEPLDPLANGYTATDFYESLMYNH